MSSSYRAGSSILHGINTGTQELKDITLKSNIATKYIVQNELFFELLNNTKSHQGDTLGYDSLLIKTHLKSRELQGLETDYSKIKDILESEIAELKTSLSNEDEQDYEIDELNKMIASLEEEFLTPPVGSDIDSVTLKNDKIYNEYCTKFNRLVYEVSGNLKQDSDNLDIGQDEDVDMDQEQHEQQEQVEQQSETTQPQQQQQQLQQRHQQQQQNEDEKLNNIYYRLSKPIKFSKFNYQIGESVVKVNQRKEAALAAANAALAESQPKTVTEPAAVTATTEEPVTTPAAVTTTTEEPTAAPAAVPATTEEPVTTPAAVPAITEEPVTAPAAVSATTEEPVATPSAPVEPTGPAPVESQTPSSSTQPSNQ